MPAYAGLGCKGRQVGQAKFYVVFPDCSEDFSAKQCGSGASVGLQMYWLMNHNPEQWECVMTERVTPAEPSDAPAARGKDYVTPAIFSGCAIIILRPLTIQSYRVHQFTAGMNRLTKQFMLQRDWKACFSQPCYSGFPSPDKWDAIACFVFSSLQFPLCLCSVPFNCTLPQMTLLTSS